jgi:two-component system, cell cycle sensor histidine kinase and response regulator CckA
MLATKLPTLEQVIDTAPLIAGPNSSVLAVIMQMNQIQDASCSLDPELQAAENILAASCALVMENGVLLGLLTERDIVRFLADGRDLANLTIADVMTRSVITLVPDDTQTVLTALNLLQQHQIRHLPVLDQHGKLLGLITPQSIRRVLQPANLLKLRRACEVMTTEVISATPTASVLSIAQLMTEHRVSCVVIHDLQDKVHPLGILTERDIVQFQILQLDLSQIQAHQVMSAPLFFVRPNDSLWDAHQSMKLRRVRRLGIIDHQGTFLGLLTQTHLLNVFDPIEFSGIVDTLQQQVEERTTQLEQINQQLLQVQSDLENRVNERTVALLQTNLRLQEEIHERQQAEAELRHSQQQLTDFVENATIGMHWVAADGQILWANQAELDLLGYSREEYIGRSITEFHAESDVIDDILCRLTRNEVLQGYSAKLLAKDGSIREVLINSNVYWENDEFIHTRCFTRDVTSQVDAERERQQTEKLLDLTTDAIILRDFENRILFWNHGAEKLYGWIKEEALDKNVNELIYKNLSPELEVARKTVVEQGEWQGELEKINKLGQELTVQSRWTLVRDETGNPKSILAVDTDITEKKLLEGQFLRAQRLESLGTLASGIAHDLNNILTPILAIAQLLPFKLPHLDAQNQRLLQMLQDSSKRGSDLVSQILSFARGAEGKRTTIQAGHLLLEVGRVVKQTFPKSIAVHEDVTPPELWMVSADATQLHQVFMNLCINARDAMPDGGTLGLEAKNIRLDANYARMHLNAQEGPYVAIKITDTGMGIAADVLDRIFEPFFTTKELGKGTGLGLSTVMTIVKQHDGFVTVYSEANMGTCFTVYLPALESVDIDQSPENLEVLAGNGELILVIDDEASIREITRVSLETHNYQVITACDGIDAFSVYAEHKREVSMIILDLMMPLLDTSTIIRTLRRMNPQVQIIAMSGLAPSQAIAQSEATAIQAFLQKPFTAYELLRAIHQVKMNLAID